MTRNRYVCFAILICLFTLGLKTNQVQAVGYAYSIGTKDGAYDYSESAIYAKNSYAKLNNVISHSITTPTKSVIRGNNPNGNRIISSKIVFLVGYSNYQRIYFEAKDGSTTYKTGVCYGNDKTDEGYDFAGLNSTDMSNCKVITFAGCETANNNYENNLVKKAVARGAKTAVGFRKLVNLTTSNGKGWLRKYNDGLGSGKTVSQSIRMAVDSYPNIEMSTWVQIAGLPTQVAGTQNVTSTQEIIKVENIQNNQEKISVENFDGKQVIKAVKEYDQTFEPEDYRVSVNFFDDYGDGVIIFTYVIDGEIETNKAYICHVENNAIVEIKKTQQDIENEKVGVKNIGSIQSLAWDNFNIAQPKTLEQAEEEVDEGELLELVHKYLEKYPDALEETKGKNIKGSEKRFYYDYFTGTLSYESTNFILEDEGIKDYHYEIVLN